MRKLNKLMLTSLLLGTLAGCQQFNQATPEQKVQWACIALRGAVASYDKLNVSQLANVDQTGQTVYAGAKGLVNAICEKPFDPTKLDQDITVLMDAAGQIIAAVEKAKTI